MTVIVPADRQWQRIVTRLGHPQFVIAVATDLMAIHPQAFSVTDARVIARAERDGQPLEIGVTNQFPRGYSSTSQTALTFSASPGDRVDLTIRMTPSEVPNDAFLMVAPLWDPFEFWDWGDGMAMGQGLFELASPIVLFVGVALIFVGVVVGLMPLRPDAA